MPVRWVGFDMDECIGSLMPLFEYIHLLPNCLRTQKERAELFTSIAHAMYESERNGKTWLIRPAIFDAMKLLWHAYSNKQVKGAFIYSNNSGSYLVQFLAYFLNVSIQRLMNLSYVPEVFQMAAWNGIACRRTYGLVKSFESIQTCLRAHGLPECSSERDLLFFDDMVHVLQMEIPYYIKVPAYFNHTPAMLVIETLSEVGTKLSCAKWAHIANKSLDMQIGDFKRPDNHYILSPPDNDEYLRDLRMFQRAFQAFLQNA